MEYPKFNKDISLSESVYQTVCEQITTGNLKPGQKITEAWLAETMGISRAPVREAFKRLSEDRLVILVPRSGCFIAKLSSAEIEEIYEIRKYLEPMALDYAINNFNKKEIEVLRNKFLDCQKLDGGQFISSAVALDAEFHALIAAKSGCTNLQELLGKLRSRIQIFRVKEAHCHERAIAALKEHLDIINAIFEGNKKEALAALVRHIEHAKRTVFENKSKENQL